jgi:pyruvate/2-oxoglutarate dehydrogenase complex dihydrolipoamide dehydrogenase (E3) component
MPSQFDVIVIGSGSAGFSAAEAARAVGATVCLIEKEKLGGECPNWACVPSKALLKAAKVYRTVRGAQAFGTVPGGVSFDWTKVVDYRRRVVETITGGGQIGERYIRLAQKLGLEVEMGEAVFMDAQTVEVKGKRLHGRAFVIATGTTEFIPPIPGLGEIHYLTSREAVMLELQPQTMAVIGGGPVGCELATIFASFGTRVVLLQSAPDVLDREDHEISALVRQSLTDLGVEVVVDAKISEVINARGGVYGLKVASPEGTTTHAVNAVLVAAGKRSNTFGLGLETVGVRLDERGTVVTDRQQRTSTRNIFAAGDVDGGLMFTHTAHHEGAVAGRNAALFAKGKRTPLSRSDERVVPRATFVSPEVASVGMIADEVRQKFKKALVGRYHVVALGRAVTDSAKGGLVKIVAHPKSRKVLGCHIAAERAGEMVHEAALAIYLGATVDKLADMIHAYPTYSEGLAAAAANAKLE